MTTLTPVSQPARRPCHEPLGEGIRRDHQADCTGSRACRCPLSFWLPQENGHRRRATVYGTLADARRAKQQAADGARERRRQRHNRQAGALPMPTIAEWFSQLMERSWGQNRVSTQERRRQDYEQRIAPALGTKRLNTLTPYVIEHWLYQLIDRDGNRRCVQAAFETLEAMLAVAVEHRLLPENAAKAVRYPTDGLQHRQHRVLTREQYDALLTACRTPGERCLVRVLTEAGLRRSEAIALQVGDLDLDSGFLHVQRRAYRTSDGSVNIDLPKSHKPRWAAINASLADELRGHIATLTDQGPTGWVWVRQNRYTKGEVVPLTGVGAYKVLQRIARHAGLLDPDGAPWVSPHVLRATGASLAVAAGVSPHIAQQQLGHARVDTTVRHYLHLPVKEPLRQIGAVFD